MHLPTCVFHSLHLEPDHQSNGQTDSEDGPPDPFGEVFNSLKEIGENAVDADELIQLAYDESCTKSSTISKSWSQSISPVSSSKRSQRQGSIDWSGLTKTGIMIHTVACCLQCVLHGLYFVCFIVVGCVFNFLCVCPSLVR
jgi:hypothetical protein